ncbi:hypothetical protein GCM10023335_02610 [Streptomyces siamensis]|uniref:Uncharacterized protein n=1 Tax=Streptomyces siamensis TaxID=1274986 RepID=A0ABP9ID56_9ACTN
MPGARRNADRPDHPVQGIELPPRAPDFEPRQTDRVTTLTTGRGGPLRSPRGPAPAGSALVAVTA